MIRKAKANTGGSEMRKMETRPSNKNRSIVKDLGTT